jgi:hypothetical protein
MQARKWMAESKHPSTNRFERSPGLWVIVAAVLLLNIWYDTHHPGGFVFDAFIAVVLLLAYLSKSR